MVASAALSTSGAGFLRRRPSLALPATPPVTRGRSRLALPGAELQPTAVSGARGGDGPGPGPGAVSAPGGAAGSSCSRGGAAGLGLAGAALRAALLPPRRPPARAQDDPDAVGLPGRAMLPAHGVCHPHRLGRGVQRRAPGRVGRLLRQPESRPRPHLLQSAPRRPRVPQVQDEGSERRVPRLLPVLAGPAPHGVQASARAAKASGRPRGRGGGGGCRSWWLPEGKGHSKGLG